MTQLRIHSIETMGAQDGPGLRMVVFTQGCHMRCAYCHNPDTWNASGGIVVDIDDLVARAVRQKEYFGKKGGVTVSGGEPTLQRRELREFFLELHAQDINTCLDTNGYILDDDVRALYDETDLVLLDIKHIDDEKHRRLTGVSNATSLAAAAYRESTGKSMWLRYVLVPGWTDDPDDLRRWAEHFAGYKCVQRVGILPYHRLGAHKWAALGVESPLKNIPPPNEEIKQRAFDIFSKVLKNVVMK